MQFVQCALIGSNVFKLVKLHKFVNLMVHFRSGSRHSLWQSGTYLWFSVVLWGKVSKVSTTHFQERLQNSLSNGLRLLSGELKGAGKLSTLWLVRPVQLWSFSCQINELNLDLPKTLKIDLIICHTLSIKSNFSFSKTLKIDLRVFCKAWLSEGFYSAPVSPPTCSWLQCSYIYAIHVTFII